MCCGATGFRIPLVIALVIGNKEQGAGRAIKDPGGLRAGPCINDHHLRGVPRVGVAEKRAGVCI